MKLFLLSICLLCFIGCGNGDNQQAGGRVVYPALTESPPPPLATRSDLPEEPTEVFEPQIPSNTDTSQSWIEKIEKKEALINDLKEQAAKAKPGDSFALSEEDIEELSKIDDLAIY